MSTTTPSEDADHHDDPLKMVLAEIGGALEKDETTYAEAKAKELLSEIRRRKRKGGSQ